MGIDIKSLSQTRWINRKWDLNIPSLLLGASDLQEYTVQRGEDMRIDLVMKSIYDDIFTFSQIDVILHINNIMNPLNIREGMVLYYPPSEALEEYRYYEEGSVASNKSIRQRLGYLNKTTRVDDKRKKFLDSNYSLPPVVLPESRPSVIIDETKIKVGGL
jgi:hypothetical protein